MGQAAMADDQYRRGMELLRSSAKWALISIILGVIALAPFLYTLILSLTIAPRGITAPTIPSRPLEDLASLLAKVFIPLAIGLILVLAAAVTRLFAVYARFIPSATTLARWRESLSTPSKLIMYGYWGSLIAGVLSLAVIGLGLVKAASLFPPGLSESSHMYEFLGALMGGLALGIIAGILSILAWVGSIMLFFELSSSTGIRDFQTAAIISIVNIVLGVAVFFPYIALVVILVDVALEALQWYFVMEGAGKALAPPTSQQA
ncbi:MAG: hypothetical protein ABWK01_03395 [Infirmifilum sp.]